MKRAAIVIAIAMLCMLTACGAAPKSEGDIQADISGFGCLPEGVVVEDVEVRLRDTEKKESDEVWVTLTASAGDVDYALDYVLYYKYYDKGGWVLQEVARDPSGAWEIGGVEESALRRAIEENALYPGDVTHCALENETVSDDLTEYRARVLAERETENALLEMQYDIAYTIGADGWAFSTITGQVLRAVPKEGMAQDAILEYITAAYGTDAQYAYAESDYENGMETHYVSLLSVHTYMTQRDNLAVQCSFDPQSLLWEITGCEDLGTEYEWDALGTWTCSGEDDDVRALITRHYSYSAVATVTQEDAHTLKVVYDVTGFLRYDNNISGTVYFDLTEDPYHKATGLSKEHWYLESGRIDSYATIRFDADVGLTFRQDGSGSLICTRE